MRAMECAGGVIAAMGRSYRGSDVFRPSLVRLALPEAHRLLAAGGRLQLHARGSQFRVALQPVSYTHLQPTRPY